MGRVSVDIDHDGGLRIYRWLNFESDDKVEIKVAAHEIPDLVRDLANHAMNALTGVAAQMQQGDCPRCRNTRLVEERKPNGRTESVHCPDCSHLRQGEPFEIYPRIGGGVKG